MTFQILKLKSTDRIRESNKRKPPTQTEYPSDAHGVVLPVARLYPAQSQQPDFSKFCNGLRGMRWLHRLRRPSWRDGSVNSHIINPIEIFTHTCTQPMTVQNLEKGKYRGEIVSIKSADIPVNPCMRCVWRGMQSGVAEAPFFCLWQWKYRSTMAFHLTSTLKFA